MADLTTISNEIPSANAARLPALGAPELSVDYLSKIKEICEVLLGRRGSTWDRAVTFRDMQDGGLGGFIPGMVGSAAFFNPGTGQITTDNGATFDIDAALRESSAYKDLLTRIGSAEELENLPEQISLQLREALAQLARERGADIRSLEGKLQNEQLSLAWRLDEVTASLNTAAAGAREYNAAYADDLRAVATRVEQVAADLAAGGGGVEVQEQLTAISDAVDGLKGQWSLKIQTNPTAGQPPVIAGIALAVEDPIAGPGTSSLIFLADKVGFYTAGGTLNPFSIVGNMVTMTNVRARSLRIEMADGTLVLDAASTLAQQTSSAPNMVPALSAWPTKSGTGVGTGGASNDPRFLNGEYGFLPSQAGYSGFSSQPLGIQQNVTYTVSFDVYTQAGTRTFYANMYGGNVVAAGRTVTATTTATHYTFTESMTQSDAALAVLRLYAVDAGTTGAGIVIYNVMLTIGAKERPWNDSVITASNAKSRVFIPYLSALSAFFGSAQLGIGGALWAGQTDYDTGTGLRLGTDGSGNPYLSMRSSNGKYLRIKPSTETFEWNGVKISQPTYDTFTLSSAGGGAVAGPNGTLSNSVTLTITGNNGPHKVVWNLTRLTGGVPSTPVFMDASGNTASVSASASNTTINVQVSAVITGADGRTLNFSDVMSLTFGSA